MPVILSNTYPPFRMLNIPNTFISHSITVKRRVSWLPHFSHKITNNYLTIIFFKLQVTVTGSIPTTWLWLFFLLKNQKKKRLLIYFLSQLLNLLSKNLKQLSTVLIFIFVYLDANLRKETRQVNFWS